MVFRKIQLTINIKLLSSISMNKFLERNMRLYLIN